MATGLRATRFGSVRSGDTGISRQLGVLDRARPAPKSQGVPFSTAVALESNSLRIGWWVLQASNRLFTRCGLLERGHRGLVDVTGTLKPELHFCQEVAEYGVEWTSR